MKYVLKPYVKKEEPIETNNELEEKQNDEYEYEYDYDYADIDSGFFSGTFQNKTMVILLSVICFFVLISGSIVTYLIFQKVDNICIFGDSIYEEEFILQAADIELDDSMFFINCSVLEEKLTTELPYLSEVKVIKDTDVGIIILILSTTDDYMIINNGLYSFSVDENLKVLSIGVEEIQGVYTYYGFDIQEIRLGETATFSDDDFEKLQVAKAIATSLNEYDFTIDIYVDFSIDNQLIIHYDLLTYKLIGDIEDFVMTDSLLTKLIEYDSQF